MCSTCFLYIINPIILEIVNKTFNYLNADAYARLFSAFRLTQSQVQQEVFVLMRNCFSTHGFFVEFGATDGKTLSNTFLLEKYMDWKGILVEPNKSYHKALKENRNCIIDKRCIYKTSNQKIKFSENQDVGELSAIEEYLPKEETAKDHINLQRAIKLKDTNTKTYKVETVSLLDLLDQHNAPKLIDYISIDTEGSEYDILKAFDFDKYTFRTITVEHNFENYREKIQELLEEKGYVRVLTEVSRYDDWYINPQAEVT